MTNPLNLQTCNHLLDGYHKDHPDQDCPLIPVSLDDIAKLKTKMDFGDDVFCYHDDGTYFQFFDYLCGKKSDSTNPFSIDNTDNVDPSDLVANILTMQTLRLEARENYAVAQSLIANAALNSSGLTPEDYLHAIQKYNVYRWLFEGSVLTLGFGIAAPFFEVLSNTGVSLFDSLFGGIYLEHTVFNKLQQAINSQGLCADKVLLKPDGSRYQDVLLPSIHPYARRAGKFFTMATGTILTSALGVYSTSDWSLNENAKPQTKKHQTKLSEKNLSAEELLEKFQKGEIDFLENYLKELNEEYNRLTLQASALQRLAILAQDESTAQAIEKITNEQKEKAKGIQTKVQKSELHIWEFVKTLSMDLVGVPAVSFGVVVPSVAKYLESYRIKISKYGQNVLDKKADKIVEAEIKRFLKNGTLSKPSPSSQCQPQTPESAEVEIKVAKKVQLPSEVTSDLAVKASDWIKTNPKKAALGVAVGGAVSTIGFGVATGAITANDLTGIGIADDMALPFTASATVLSLGLTVGAGAYLMGTSQVTPHDLIKLTQIQQPVSSVQTNNNKHFENLRRRNSRLAAHTASARLRANSVRARMRIA